MHKRPRHHKPHAPSGFFSHIWHLFRERQIYVRSKGQVQFVTVRPYMQVVGLFILMSGFFWIAFASINVTFKDELIAVKERHLHQSKLDNEERIIELRQKIDMLNEKLLLDQQGYLGEVDKVRRDYRQLVERHNRLTEFFRQGWMPLRQTPANQGLKPGFPGGKQNMTPNRTGKGSFNERNFSQKYASAFSSKRAVLAPLADMRKQMASFEAMQVALLDEVVAFASKETSKVSRIYAKLGINAKQVLKSGKSVAADSVGGPFIAAKAEDFGSKLVIKRMQLAVMHLNQRQKLQRLSSRLPLAMPVKNISRFSSRFGLRRDPLRRVAAMHTGIDIKAPYGAPVKATTAGVIIYAGWAGGYGRFVKIQHDNGVTTRYGHMSKILVKKGDVVKAGTSIGLLGNSGRSTGAHLHYETRLNGRAMDPTRFWKARHDFQTTQKR